MSGVVDAEHASLIIQGALTQGFGWVMLYGGVTAWITAALSWGVFRGTRTVPATGGA
ncbi:MAG: hypothetical protein I8H77_15760, partial [Comamonadaceae bacterium]|nr:hypothetical protein [Comamonadaceae bacterium]